MKRVDGREVLDKLVAGETRTAAAAAVGCSYGTLRQRLSRHLRASGSRTIEQAVANHVAAKIKAVLPPELQGRVDQVLGKK